MEQQVQEDKYYFRVWDFDNGLPNYIRFNLVFAAKSGLLIQVKASFFKSVLNDDLRVLMPGDLVPQEDPKQTISFDIPLTFRVNQIEGNVIGCHLIPYTDETTAQIQLDGLIKIQEIVSSTEGEVGEKLEMVRRTLADISVNINRYLVNLYLKNHSL